MGVIQQLLGHLDYVLYHGSNGFKFAEIMGGLAIYAAIILLIIHRDVAPKQQCIDLIFFFVGLDLFYYLYIFIVELIPFLTDKLGFTDNYNYQDGYFQKTINEIRDFIEWTSIGVAAAAWAFVATKFRNMEKKKLYVLMLLPLFIVIAFQLLVAAFGTVMCVLEQLKIYTPEVGSYDFLLCSTLTALVCLVVCLRKFCKKPAAEKSVEQG